MQVWLSRFVEQVVWESLEYKQKQPGAVYGIAYGVVYDAVYDKAGGEEGRERPSFEPISLIYASSS